MQYQIRLIFSLTILCIIVALCISSYFVATPNAADYHLANRLCGLSWQHPLGCDLYGGDLLIEILHGARTSLYIAISSVTISIILGTLIGSIAGFYGGILDIILMRLAELIMTFPGILIAMALASLIGTSSNIIILAIVISGWITPARIVRIQIMSTVKHDYIAATKIMGASSPYIIIKHLIPAVTTSLSIIATFSLSGVILIESSLSFLGLGASDISPSWGGLLNQGRSALTEAPHLAIIPGLLLMLTILAFNFLGDELRDWLDPKEQTSHH